MIQYLLFAMLLISECMKIACVGDNPECTKVFTCDTPKFVYEKMKNCIIGNYSMLLIPLDNCNDFNVCEWINFNKMDNTNYVSYLEDINHNKLNNTLYNTSNLGTTYTMQIINYLSTELSAYIRIFKNIE